MVVMVPPCIYSRDQGERPVLLGMRKCDVNKIDLAPCLFRSDGFRPKWPRHFGSFGPLLVSGPEANRATAGDLPQPQAHFKLQSKNFFDLAHGLCSREHNPCNVPDRVMWPRRGNGV
jgi:hypothetical protein